MNMATASVSDIAAQFAEFCAAHGMILPAGHPIADGKIHRFQIGKRAKHKDRGWYILYADGNVPTGIVADWGEGQQLKWMGKRDGGRLDRHTARREINRVRAAREQQRTDEQEQAAATAQTRWKSAKAAPAAHPYLKRKDIKSHGARVEGDALLIPVMQPGPVISSVQSIQPDGLKRYHKGGRMQGGFFVVGPKPSGCDLPIIICEGFATGCTLTEATGYPVIIAFHASNIPVVATWARGEFGADRPFIIAADNDRGTRDNPGVTYATQASKAIGASLAVPAFAEAEKGSDFNDIAALSGVDTVRRAIETATNVTKEPAPVATVHEIAGPSYPADAPWQRNLVYKADGITLDAKKLVNFRLMMTHHKDVGGRIRLDQFTGEEMAYGLPWRPDARPRRIDDTDTARAREWLQQHGLVATKDETRDAIHEAALAHAFHPIRDYLGGLKWDGVNRLEDWLQDCLGVEDSAYVRTIGPKVLISAVARVMQPGCKVDTVLVLEGEQGVGKSTALKALFGEDCTRESVSLFGDHKKMVMTMAGAWVVELAEFVAVRRSEQSNVKGLITTTTDTVVLPYARTASNHPRQCIFIGTINPTDSGYLSDETGNRRYWPVTCGDIDVERLASSRDRLWAEALARYRAGELWHLNAAERRLAEAEQATRRERDPWEPIVDRKLQARTVTTTDEVLDMLAIPHERKTRGYEMRAAKILAELGYQRKRQRTAAGLRYVYELPGFGDA